MNFQEAIKKCLGHEKVRRSCWQEGHYWTTGEDKKLINSVGDYPSINEHQVEATDWELFGENFCLSNEHINSAFCIYYKEEDVKEFIKRLKETAFTDDENFDNELVYVDTINKLAGDRLLK